MPTKRPTQRNRSTTKKPSQKVGERPPTPKELARIERYAAEFDQALNGYLELHPNWVAETLLWIMEFGFKQLQHYVEVEKVPGINWDNPFLHYNFPMSWDWEQWKSGQTSQLICCEPFTPHNTRTKAVARKMMAKALVQLTTYTTLHHLTHYVGVEKRGNRYSPILSSPATEELAKIKNARKRKRAFEDFFHPYSMGAGLVSFDEAEMPADGSVPKSLMDQLNRLQELIDIPNVSVSIDKDGCKMKMLLSFQIHPYELDVPKRHACFPMMAGIMIQPELEHNQDLTAALDDPRLDPSTWSKKDRDQLWQVILKSFKDLRANLYPRDDEELHEAVIEVSAKIKVTIRRGEPDPTQRMANLLKTFEANGEVLHVSFNKQGLAFSSLTADTEIVSLLESVENEPNKNKKGAALEALIVTLFKSINGFEVKHHERTQTEEIDLVVINNSPEPRWKDCGPLVLVECKNWSSNCGKNELVQFESKIRNRRGKCQLGFLVSWNGFGTTLKKELLRSSHEQVVVGLLGGSDIREAVKSGDFLSVLRRSWEDSVMA